MFFEAPCYFFPCSFRLRPCGVFENGEPIGPVKTNVVCSVFVGKVIQEEKPNKFAYFCAVEASLNWPYIYIYIYRANFM